MKKVSIKSLFLQPFFIFYFGWFISFIYITVKTLADFNICVTYIAILANREWHMEHYLSLCNVLTSLWPFQLDPLGRNISWTTTTFYVFSNNIPAYIHNFTSNDLANTATNVMRYGHTLDLMWAPMELFFVFLNGLNYLHFSSQNTAKVAYYILS